MITEYLAYYYTTHVYKFNLCFSSYNNLYLLHTETELVYFDFLFIKKSIYLHYLICILSLCIIYVKY